MQHRDYAAARKNDAAQAPMRHNFCKFPSPNLTELAEWDIKLKVITQGAFLLAFRCDATQRLRCHIII